jgi:hypothetical protein
MAAQIEKKEIFPRLVFYRSRFDLRQVDAAAGEGLEHSVQHAGLVLNGKNERSFIIAARPGIQLPDNHKPRDIVALVFDVRRHRLQIVNFLRHRAGNGCQGAVRSGFYCRVARARHLIDWDRREVARKPAAALRQGLWMRNNAFYIGYSARSRQQIMVYLQKHFRADL